MTQDGSHRLQRGHGILSRGENLAGGVSNIGWRPARVFLGTLDARGFGNQEPESPCNVSAESSDGFRPEIAPPIGRCPSPAEIPRPLSWLSGHRLHDRQHGYCAEAEEECDAENALKDDSNYANHRSTVPGVICSSATSPSV